MNALLPFLVLDQSCDQVLSWADEKLAHEGFHTQQTFDLHIARLAHPDCPCPYHGTDRCNCQMVVLLVYGKQETPSTLIIHGQDGKSWVSLAGPVGRHSNQHLDHAIRRILIPPIPSIPLSIKVSYGT